MAGVNDETWPQPPGSAPRHSLKWRALLLSSLFLLALNSAFSGLLYLSLSRQFEALHQIKLVQYGEQLDGLLRQSSRHLLQVAEMIPVLQGMEAALGADATGARGVRQAFDLLWPDLQLDLGIDLAQLYGVTGAMIGEWRGYGVDQCQLRADPGLAREVNTSEIPATELNCQGRCAQYAFSPLLVRGEHVGVAVLGRSLAEIVVNFRRVSGIDLAMLSQPRECAASPSNPAPAPLDGPRALGPWGVEVWALTQADQNFSILQQAAREHPRMLELGEGVRVERDGRTYGLRPLSLQGVSDARGLVIEDLTDNLAAIRAALFSSLAVGGLGLLISGALLIGGLWRPIGRLRRAAAAMPLLAANAYAEVRTAIQPAQGRHSGDEFDVLEHSILDTADRLEVLNAQVRRRTAMLNARMQELEVERDFLGHLMDTAQGVIMVLDTRLRIRSVNQYAERLLGRTESELLSRPFNLLLPPDGGSGVLGRLRQLADGNLSRVEEELSLLVAHGRRAHLAWAFARMGQFEGNEPLIIAIGLDITARREAESRLAWLASHDPVTRLLNRGQFQETFRDELVRAAASGETGALFYLNLDNFKFVNDSLGQRTGDLLLARFGSELESVLREQDCVARLGGDEFVVLLPATGRDAAELLATQLIARVQQRQYELGEHLLGASVSLGIALYPEHGEDVHELLATADAAMYQAKRAGGGRYHVYAPERDERERARHSRYWEDRLRRALLHDYFLLHFQPIQSLHDGRISHYEVLVRMQEPGIDGLSMPGDFIPAAERSGQVLEIDLLVIRKALDRLRDLEQAGEDLTLAINLSGGFLHHEEMQRSLIDLLHRSPTRPERVIFEITETAAVTDLAAARSLVLSVRELGCRFALDDFGTGFSSFHYLRQLPFDYVKIDGSFVRALPRSPEDQTVVRALVEVARGFGKRIIAEFVEDQETCELLREMGVDYAQGYHIGRPGTQIPVPDPGGCNGGPIG